MRLRSLLIILALLPTVHAMPAYATDGYPSPNCPVGTTAGQLNAASSIPTEIGITGTITACATQPASPATYFTLYVFEEFWFKPFAVGVYPTSGTGPFSGELMSDHWPDAVALCVGVTEYDLVACVSVDHEGGQMQFAPLDLSDWRLTVPYYAGFVGEERWFPGHVIGPNPGCPTCLKV